MKTIASFIAVSIAVLGLLGSAQAAPPGKRLPGKNPHKDHHVACLADQSGGGAPMIPGHPAHR